MVRRDPDGVMRRYAHLGTGNYNSVTARFYTDISLLTSRPEITAAVQKVFRYLTARADSEDYSPLLMRLDCPAEASFAEILAVAAARFEQGQQHSYLPYDELLEQVAAESDRRGEPIRLGAYEVTLIESHHSPPDRFPGVIDGPLSPPVKVSAYRCGEAWSTLVHHLPSGRRLLIQGSAGFGKGVLTGQRADAVYLGVGQLGVLPPSYLLEYWNETVRAVGARRVILIHWDDFFRPLSKPLRALPYVVDDLGVSIRILDGLAAQDGVELHLPTLWRRENPWL